MTAVHKVSEDQIKMAMRVVLEKMEVVLKPSCGMGLVVALYHEEFWRMVEREAPAGLDIGVVFYGRNL